MKRPLGQPVRVSTLVTVKDVNGNDVPTDPGTIKLTVRKPDFTFLPDFTTPTHPSTGNYYVELSTNDLANLGQYRWLWVTTGTAAGVTPRAGGFEIVDPFTPAHITYEDARERLNISAASNAEIQDMIDSAIQEQENRVGPVAPRSVTRTVYPSSGVLLLPPPVISITSITPAGGSPLSLVGLDLSGLSAGIVRPGSLGGFWASSYTTVIVAGRNPVPQDLVEAALLRVQHSYETQRGPADSAFSDVTEGGGSAFILLLRAQDKERPYVMPAVA